MLTFLSDFLTIMGTLILAGALIPVRQLIKALPLGPLRRKWYMLTGLIISFILGYIGYTVTFWKLHVDKLELIVPVIFFFGAGFVWLTSTLSLQTANDIRRVALLERENVTDPLMGIFNRRYFDRRIEEEYSRARRYGLPVSLILLDIDHFKRINDTYGHHSGDLVLKYLGKLLQDAVRESDIVARFGGEELMIIAPNTNSSSAITLAERLRQHVTENDLIVPGETESALSIRITVSIGVAQLCEKETGYQQWINRADEALYQAKLNGRNLVVGANFHPTFQSPNNNLQN